MNMITHINVLKVSVLQVLTVLIFQIFTHTHHHPPPHCRRDPGPAAHPSFLPRRLAYVDTRTYVTHCYATEFTKQKKFQGHLISRGVLSYFVKFCHMCLTRENEKENARD